MLEPEPYGWYTVSVKLNSGFVVDKTAKQVVILSIGNLLFTDEDFGIHVIGNWRNRTGSLRM